jgi:hypothetical protein
MLSFQIVFIVTVTRTAASGIAAAGIAVFGDTRNLGQRAVLAETAPGPRERAFQHVHPTVQPLAPAGKIARASRGTSAVNSSSRLD